MRFHAYILGLLLSTLSLAAAEFDLGTRGTLSVTVPESWIIRGKAVNRPDGSLLGYAMAIKPRGDAHAKCLLTLVYNTNGAPNKEVLRNEVLRSTQPFVAESVEQKQNLKELSLESGYGGYCLFTDGSLVGKRAKGDDYKVMGSGQVQPAANMVGVISLFADEADGPEMRAMVKMLNSLKVKPRKAK